MTLWVMVGKVLTRGSIVMLNKTSFGIGKLVKIGHKVQGQTLVNRSKMKLRSLETNKIFLVFFKIRILLELK